MSMLIARLAASNIERSCRPLGTARHMAAVMASPDQTADLARITGRYS
jgi:hypothetical protein